MTVDVQRKFQLIITKKMESFIVTEWFLSMLLDYLEIPDIGNMDSAICNKSNRAVWLECIANDLGSVSTKLRQEVIHDEAIEWCSKRNVRFKCLEISNIYLDIATRAASLLSVCCTDMVELQLGHNNVDGVDDDVIPSMQRVLNEFAKQCSKLKKLRINGTQISDIDIIPLILHNPDLEEISMKGCYRISEECFFAMSTHCHKLRKVSFCEVEITDQVIAALVSVNPDLEGITISKCYSQTNALMTISEHCHKLRWINCEFSDPGFIALVSKNPDLESVSIAGLTHNGLKELLYSNHDLIKIDLINSPSVTDESLQLIIDNCPKLRTIHLALMDSITDKGVAGLVLNNRDLNDILIWECKLLTNASLISVVEYCHNLRRITLVYLPMTNEGFATLMSNNRDLEYIDVSTGPLLTKTYIATVLAQLKHKCCNISIIGETHCTVYGVLTRALIEYLRTC